jgi:outer membrane protein OmpA-like peptidoglycan-associated protein
MVISLLVAILMHIVLFVSLGHIKMGFGWTNDQEEVTRPVVVRPVEEDVPRDIPSASSDEPAPVPDRTKLVDDVEILERLKDPELDMKSEVEVASFDVDSRIEAPALAGDPAGDQPQVAAELEIAPEELDSLGQTETITPAVAQGQMIVDPGNEMTPNDPLDSFMKDLIKKGSAGKAIDGKFDGTSSLDEIAGLPENVLVTKTTMLPGDLLFEYNSAQLRESSKVGMQKIALVMDLNPQLYCWIEGHTDLIGSDDFNRELSLRRAESVKTFLVAMGMNAEKIRTLPLGKQQPLVLKGDQDEQAINRRVEIKMRKTPPDESPRQPPALVEPPARAVPVMPEPVPEPPKAQAIRVKPLRALPVAEDPVTEAPKAATVIIEETPPRAAAVEEQPAPRAQAVEE